ncbi:nephrin [Eurytemora carolleeae]|uniref:nephrin n=1 Tax=Eurytemora carolleeae TaxID=1294199 RepID=UPI000C77B426|nr:nephrin [Eurytemora carolleeae]|eukprot:XP_023343974.1 nephrin-like [Eurytemora affinis]
MKEAVVETVDCQVVGSRPTPHIIWKLGNQTLQGHTIRHRDNNVTVSRVKIQPFKNRTGLSLTCEASTPGIPEIVISDKLILNVQHEPQVSLRLGQNLDSLNIREGNDVYFVCEVQANPAVKVITWRFNGLEISKGVHRSGNNLIIQNLGRQWEGMFTCQAKNELGEGTSRELKLNIKYAPVCAEGQQQVYETMRGEQLAVSCLVHANPIILGFSGNSTTPRGPIT